MMEALNETKIDFRERIKHVDEFCSRSLTTVEKTMDRVERMARDGVNKKEALLEEKFLEAVADMKDQMYKLE
jgi:hypothetical protein